VRRKGEEKLGKSAGVEKFGRLERKERMIK
jgi:hypothetical protein